MLYFSSASFRNRLAYAIGNHPSGYCCSRTAPRPGWLASHFRREFCCQNVFFSVIFDISFIFSSVRVLLCECSRVLLCESVAIVFCCSLCFFLNNGLIGSSKLARLGINFMSWCIEPIRESSCLNVFGVLS